MYVYISYTRHRGMANIIHRWLKLGSCLNCSPENIGYESKVDITVKHEL